MNVFLLSGNARRAARYHSNKHVVKMILEVAQLLCTAHAVLDHGGLQVPLEVFGEGDQGPAKTYKPTHKNHPWAIAVRRQRDLYVWVAQLGLALCREYSKRYAGKRHASQRLLEALERVPPRAFESEKFVPEAFKDTTETRRVALKSPSGTPFRQASSVIWLRTTQRNVWNCSCTRSGASYRRQRATAQTFTQTPFRFRESGAGVQRALLTTLKGHTSRASCAASPQRQGAK